MPNARARHKPGRVGTPPGTCPSRLPTGRNVTFSQLWRAPMPMRAWPRLPLRCRQSLRWGLPQGSCTRQCCSKCPAVLPEAAFRVADLLVAGFRVQGFPGAVSRNPCPSHHARSRSPPRLCPQRSRTRNLSRSCRYRHPPRRKGRCHSLDPSSMRKAVRAVPCLRSRPTARSQHRAARQRHRADSREPFYRSSRLPRSGCRYRPCRCRNADRRMKHQEGPCRRPKFRRPAIQARSRPLYRRKP
ncbi:hypothetical protein SAMN05216557_10437 [Sphingomonas carotinifaciens]|uniref:Uncharacterized protein n=1 Tax=Sphingomonas carotinifaciens TaxID=1166323 RepID=A0A1G7M0U1_9SPHN|nr:hypothetical protein SAMN05216557_10437 [Sphingomonas carotinifaciens]